MEGQQLGNKKLPTDLSVFKVDQELLSVESVSDRWVSEDSDCFYYKINNDGQDNS